MRRLNIYPRAAGDTVELRVQPNAKFISYVVFIRQHTQNGQHTVEKHLPGANGEIQFQLQLQPCRGYDLIFVGVPKSAGGAKIRFDIAFNGPLSGNLSKEYPVTNSVSAVGWTILV